MLTDDKAASVSIWCKTFNHGAYYNELEETPAKVRRSPNTGLPRKAQCEIAAFCLAFPDDVLSIFDTTILEKLTEAEKGQPWIYQQHLEDHFVEQDDAIRQRLIFFNYTIRVSHKLRHPNQKYSQKYKDLRVLLYHYKDEILGSSTQHKHNHYALFQL